MSARPLGNKALGPIGQHTGDRAKGVETDRGAVLAIGCVEMSYPVMGLVVVHRNDDPVEAADAGHGGFLPWCPPGVPASMWAFTQREAHSGAGTWRDRSFREAFDIAV